MGSELSGAPGGRRHQGQIASIRYALGTLPVSGGGRGRQWTAFTQVTACPSTAAAGWRHQSTLAGGSRTDRRQEAIAAANSPRGACCGLRRRVLRCGRPLDLRLDGWFGAPRRYASDASVPMLSIAAVSNLNYAAPFAGARAAFRQSSDTELRSLRPPDAARQAGRRSRS